MVEQSIDQCSAIALVVSGSCAGMDHHASGLIYHGEIIVFVNDVERNVFRDSTQRRAHNIAQDFDGFVTHQA